MRLCIECGASGKLSWKNQAVRRILFAGAYAEMRRFCGFRANLAIVLTLLAALPAWAAVRVALVTTGTPESTGQVIALATAQINDDAIQLVDRESIAAVLKEQKLSLSGLADPDRAIEVGKMLKADLFAVLETD